MAVHTIPRPRSNTPTTVFQQIMSRPAIIGQPLPEPCFGAEMHIEFYPPSAPGPILFAGIVAKTYPGYRIAYIDRVGGNGKPEFFKSVEAFDSSKGGYVTFRATPTRDEIMEFLFDVNHAAKERPDLAEFIRQNPALPMPNL